MSTQKGKIFIISAPSGAGKTTLVNAAVEFLSPHYDLSRIITYTTKVARHTERNGIDYHFIAHSEFERLIKEGFFLEWSSFYDNYYGTPRYILDDLNKGKSPLLIIDRVGAKQILSLIPDAITIWLSTKDLETLRQRLIMRGTETPEQINKRLYNAQQELEDEKRATLYKYHLINDDFSQALQDLCTIFYHELGALQDGNILSYSYPFIRSER